MTRSIEPESARIPSISKATAFRRTRFDAVLLIVAATLGTLPVALLSGVGLARFLPLSRDAAFAIAYVATIPIWITAMCFAFLARSGARTLVLCVAIAAALAGAISAAPRPRTDASR